MKLKLVVADQDTCYIHHLIHCVQVNYFEKLELSAFTTQDALDHYLEAQECDALLYTPDFVMPAKYEGLCFVLASEAETSEIDGVKAICKYQKMEKIYKKILSAYAETKDSYKLNSIKEKDGTRLVTFLSASGGVGKSLCAATYSTIQAMTGKRVLYLCTELFPSTREFFKGEGEVTLSQVFFAVKRARGNVPLKIESALQISNQGVLFFQPGENPLEMLEITSEDWKELLMQLIAMKKFDVIVIDAEQAMRPAMESIWELSDEMIAVSDGSSHDISRMHMLLEAIEINGKRKKERWLQKTFLLWNRTRGQRLPEKVGNVSVAGSVAEGKQLPDGEQMIRMLIESKCAAGLYHLN